MERTDLVTGTWRSLRGLSAALQLMFGGAALFSLVLAHSIWSAATAIDDATGGGPRQFAIAVDRAAVVINRQTAQWLMVLVVGVVFIVWMHRVARNDEAVGDTDDGFGPGMAIGGWFIPFANLVIPGKHLAQLWRNVGRRGVWLVWVWWALYVIGGAGLSIRRSIGSEPTAELTVLDLVEQPDTVVLAANATAAVALAFAAVAALFVVRQLSTRQRDAAVAQGLVADVVASRSRVRPAIGGAAVVLAVGAIAVVSGDPASDGVPTAFRERRPYDLEVGEDWTRVTATASETVYEVGAPASGLAPNVVVTTFVDDTIADEEELMDWMLDTLGAQVGNEILTSSVVDGEGGNRLAYVEWTFDDPLGGPVEGFSYGDVLDGTIAFAELIASPAHAGELHADVEPNLLSLHAGV